MKPLIEPNLLDKTIGFFSPKMAARRMISRMQLAVAGGYSGAKLDRATTNRWNPGTGSPNTDIIPDLPMLRARSRDQMRHAPVAIGAMNTTINNVVGTGLSYTPAIDQKFLNLTDEQAEEWQEDTKRRFTNWANSSDCAVNRRHNFYGLQKLAFRAMYESGDAFVLTPIIKRNADIGKLAIQLLEADRVCNPNRTRDTDTLIDGIELSGTTNESIAIHVAKKHPGDVAVGNHWTRVVVRGDSTGRKNVIHLFETLRTDQVRGVPVIAPILEPLKQLQRYTDAELNAAVISGLFSVFIKMDPDAFDTMFEDDAKAGIIKQAGQWTGEMESGKIVNLLPGESIESSNPGRPNAQFDPFWQAIVRQIGMALELPFEVLTMHFQSSYSAARAAMLMAHKMFRSRRDFMSTNFCQPIFELWLSNEVAAGRISARGFFASDDIRAAWCGSVWTGDGPGSIDPVKEVDAARKRVELGTSTIEAESILHDGIGFDIKHKQRVKEVNSQKRDGIYVPPAGSPVMPDGVTVTEISDN